MNENVTNSSGKKRGRPPIPREEGPCPHCGRPRVWSKSKLMKTCGTMECVNKARLIAYRSPKGEHFRSPREIDFGNGFAAHNLAFAPDHRPLPPLLGEPRTLGGVSDYAYHRGVE